MTTYYSSLEIPLLTIPVFFVFIRAAVSAGYFSLDVPATLVADVLQFYVIVFTAKINEMKLLTNLMENTEIKFTTRLATAGAKRQPLR